jgi:hypothetical protein
MATALAATAAKPNLQRLGEMPLPLYDLRIFEGVSSLTVEIVEDRTRMHVVDPTRERGSTRGRGAEDLMTLFRLTDVIRKSAMRVGHVNRPSVSNGQAIGTAP